MRLKKTSMVPLSKLADEVTRVKMEVDDTLDRCGADIIGEDHVDIFFLG